MTIRQPRALVWLAREAATEGNGIVSIPHSSTGLLQVHIVVVDQAKSSVNSLKC